MKRNSKVGKRIEGIWLSTCLLLLFLTGCGEKALQNGTNLELERDGSVQVTYIEEFPTDYYDLNELIQMNQEEVDAYNAKNGKNAVEIISTQADGNKVTLSMQYKNVSDYGNMNGGFMYHGTVAQGQSAGYHFEYTFVDAKTGETVSAIDWDNLQNHHLIVAKGPTEDYSATIFTYKKIVYATENVTVSEDGKSAVIMGNKQSIIVFK